MDTEGGDTPNSLTSPDASLLPPEVLTQCYDEMRRMARRILAGNAIGLVIQPTELANESAIRLIRANLANARDSAHLLAIAARTMRQILVDEARKLHSAKRDANALMTAWPGQDTAPVIALEDFHEALQGLALISPERAQIVELRFMFGMTVEETAATLGIAERTVKRHWQAARAWLLSRLQDHD